MSVPVDDILVTDEGAIVLIESQLTQVSPLASEALRWVDGWRTVDEIVDHLVSVFGEPAEQSAHDHVLVVLHELRDAGLLLVDNRAAAPVQTG